MLAIRRCGDKLKRKDLGRVAELMLAGRDLIGAKRWGMAQLYYRAGMSHTDIARVFGLTRQSVTGQIMRAMKTVIKAAQAVEQAEEKIPKVERGKRGRRGR